MPSYLADQYVFAINRKSKQIKINQPSVTTLTMEYTYLPADYTATDGSQDSLVEAAPDITAIELLAVGYWWLAKERDMEKFAQFEAAYKEKVKLDLAEDSATTPVRFFRPVRPYVIRGYVSKF